MIKVLVLYPELFKSYSKFSRKLDRVFSKFKDFYIVTSSDPNQYISDYCKDKNCNFDIISDLDITEIDFTHAVVFDDGEEFPNEILLIKNKKTPLRVINISLTRVINIKNDKKYKGLKSAHDYEYIGRGSYWGNPHSMFEDGEDREEVIRKYKYDFDYDNFPKKEKSEVYKLAGKRLGCFCKPLSCHGDVLADFLNQYDDGK